jgi:hypothetical protein
MEQDKAVEVVHLIFKTHLDVGFTDMARNVVAVYFDEYIPRACETAGALRQAGGRERFVWTLGSWLIYEYLEQAPAQERKILEEAIQAGDFAWHALPFTTHSELLDASLFRYGLRLAQELDRRFGRRTIAAKMTDVPGHTRAIVPLLAEAGIRFLHIGVNEASTPPDVPPVFVWRDAGGADVVVMYQHAYGGLAQVPGMAHAIAFAHTLDNLGPQTVEEVHAAFDAVREQFPGAQVVASTLDAYAHELLKIKRQLPMVTDEIGDTWIHGAGADPRKVSQFRELCRLRRGWIGEKRASPDDPALARFSRRLLLVAEHTWGMDEKTHLADYVHYRPEQLAAARSQPNFRRFEASWAEQREYVGRAVEALGESPLADEARRRLADIAPRRPHRPDFAEVADLSTAFDTEHFVLSFDPASGAIASLTDKRTGRQWASDECRLGLFGYQTFSQADYERFLSQYLVCRPEWALLDYGKPGIDAAGAQSGWWLPGLTRLGAREDEMGHRFLLELALPRVATCTTRYGGPQEVVLELDLPRSEAALHFNLQWFEKRANRLPEAVWFSFRPRLAQAGAWLMEKMGRMFSPLEVVRNGNRKLHAVERRLVYQDRDDRLTIQTLDAPLLAPGGPSLLNFDNQLPALEKGMHFNLYNNVWGTNFPMWYDEPARFRFILSLSGRYHQLPQRRRPADRV